MKKQLISIMLALCIVLNLCPTTAQAANKSNATISDGWYKINIMDTYVNIASNGGAELRNVDPTPIYYVQHVKGNNYTIITTNAKYLGLSGKAKDGVKVKEVSTPYQWTFRSEKDSDIYSLRPAGNSKLLLTASGKKNKDGTKLVLKTHKAKNAPNYAEFGFIPRFKSATTVSPTPKPTVTPKPTATPKTTVTPKPNVTPKPTETPKPTVSPKLTVTPKPTVTPRPTVTPKPTVIPGLTVTPTVTPTPTSTPTTKLLQKKLYTSSDPSVTSINKGFLMYDAEGNKVTTVSAGSELVISSNIQTIADYALYNDYIGSFTVDNHPNFTVVDGVLFNKDMTVLLVYPGEKKDKTYHVPDSVMEIANGAFGYSHYLEDIKFGSKLRVIGVDAFRGCHFSEVVIPDSVTTINGCAFNDIKELRKITIPSNTTSIPNDIIEGSSGKVVVYGANGTAAERLAKTYGHEFIGNMAVGLTTIKTGQTELEAGLSGRIGELATSSGTWVFYGSYSQFLAVFYVDGKATFIYTNNMSTYKGSGKTYTCDFESGISMRYAASFGMLPAFDEATNERLIFEFTNAFRAINGLSTLRWNDTLAVAARSHSLDMAIRAFFDHTNPDGKDASTRITEAGYSWKACAENIAMYPIMSAVDVVDGWINSPGHRKNMLTTQCDELGVGVSGSYATQNFGKQ
jgi:uncharacterized protein YkwD